LTYFSGIHHFTPISHLCYPTAGKILCNAQAIYLNSRGVLRASVCYSRLQRCLANCRSWAPNGCVIPDLIPAEDGISDRNPGFLIDTLLDPGLEPVAAKAGAGMTEETPRPLNYLEPSPLESSNPFHRKIGGMTFTRFPFHLTERRKYRNDCI